MLWSHQWTNTTPSSFARLICWISMLSYNSSLVCYRAHHAPYPNKQQTNHLTNLPYQVPHQPSCQKLDTTRIVPTASVAVPIIHTMSLYSVSNMGCFSIAFVKLNIQMDLSVNRGIQSPDITTFPRQTLALRNMIVKCSLHGRTIGNWQ